MSEAPVTMADWEKFKADHFQSLTEAVAGSLGYDRVYLDGNGVWMLESWDSETKSGRYLALHTALASRVPAPGDGTPDPMAAFAFVVPYIRHDASCSVDADEGGKCDCGMAKYLDAYRKTLAATLSPAAAQPPAEPPLCSGCKPPRRMTWEAGWYCAECCGVPSAAQPGERERAAEYVRLVRAEAYLRDFISYAPGTFGAPQREKAESCLNLLRAAALRGGHP